MPSRSHVQRHHRDHPTSKPSFLKAVASVPASCPSHLHDTLNPSLDFPHDAPPHRDSPHTLFFHAEYPSPPRRLRPQPPLSAPPRNLPRCVSQRRLLDLLQLHALPRRAHTAYKRRTNSQPRGREADLSRFVVGARRRCAAECVLEEFDVDVGAGDCGVAGMLCG